MRYSYTSLATLLTLVFATAAFSATPAERIWGFSQAAQPVKYEWRCKVGDTPQAAEPAYDDSAWTRFSPPWEWGSDKTAWIRTSITVPERLAGLPVAGTAIRLKLGVDDDGIIYINGKESQKCHWDDGSVTLTENATPGEKFVVAIKVINGPGNGGLRWANFEFSALDGVSDKLISFLRDYLYVYNLTYAPEGSEIAKQSVADAESKLDFDALDKGDKTRLLASLESARQAFAPALELAKSQKIHLIGHAHIDMNWLWLWPETIQACRDTFKSTLGFMQEFPDFRFSQSQAAAYLAMEENHPEIFKQIQARVKSGQWEITGGTWVEGDMNMASGEAIVRQILYAKRYFMEKFGVEPVICWEPDTFGHANTIPQILVKSGIKYYYFCRSGKGRVYFNWESPDGSRVLAYQEPSWYNSKINDDIINYAIRAGSQYRLNDSAVVYGVGDHGGGPTRADIEKAIELQKRPLFPTVEFSRAEDLFKAVEASKVELPVVKNELNTVFEGCYTTHSDIKKWNRESENLLPTAEAFSTIAEDHGVPYPTADFVKAWRNTCFNQFHDILDGTAIHGSYNYSQMLYKSATSIGKKALAESTKAIAKDIDTRGEGIPIVVLNPLSWQRSDTVTILASTINKPGGLAISDDKSTWPIQRNGDKLKFIAKDVPAAGYKVFWIKKSTQKSVSLVKTTTNTLENQFYKVTIDSKSGTISGIYDKLAKRQVLPAGSRAALPQILMEEPQGMSAWNIGKIKQTIDLDNPEKMELLEIGPAAASIRVTNHYNQSIITQTITLYDGVQRIDIRATADWKEIGKNGTPSPMLKVAFPTALVNAKASFETPFGSIERPINGKEVPSQKWIDLSTTNYGVSLLNDCKYGFDVTGSTMRISLLRASRDPDPTPDQGYHEMTYSLYPHNGDWKKAETARRAYELNNPLIPVFAEPHNGKLSKIHSFVSVSPANIIVTAIKKAEDSNDLVIRFYDATGSGGPAKITLGIPAKTWVETDTAERAISKPTIITGNSFTVPLRKYEFKTIRLNHQ